MPDQETDLTHGVRQTSARDVLNVLFRHKWKIVIFAAAVIGTTIVMTSSVPYTYRSDAKLLVRLGKESVTLDPTATTTGQVLVPYSRNLGDDLATEIQIMKSQSVAQKVIDELGPQAFAEARAKAEVQYPQFPWLKRSSPTPQRAPTEAELREAALGDVIESLSAKVGEDEGMTINLTYTSADPAFAQKVLAKALDAYLIQRAVVYRTEGSYAFFEEQYNRARKRMDALQDELGELKKKGDLSSVPDQITSALGRYTRLTESISQNKTVIASSVAKIAILKAALQGLPQTVVSSKTTGDSPTADSLRLKLIDLQLALEKEAATYEENSRPLQSLRRQAEKAEQLAKQEGPSRSTVTETINATRQAIEQLLLDAEASHSSDEAQSAILVKDLEGVQTELRTLSEAEMRIQQLNREIGIEEGNYRNYSEKREQARIDQAMQTDRISNISVLLAATLPTTPAGPNTQLLIMLGVILGLLGSVSIALIAERADHAIKTPDDVDKHLHLPTLASVPLTSRNTVGPAARRHSLWALFRRQGESSAPRVVPVAVRTQYEMLRDAVVFAFPASNGSNGNAAPRSETAETEPAEGGVPGSLEDGVTLKKAPRMPKARRRRIVGVVGSRRGEGVSVVAANLAASLATQGRVLLVDANMNDPATQDIFSVKESPGLVDILADSRDWQRAVVKTQVPNLDLIPAGSCDDADGGADLSQFQKLAGLLVRHYDYIVLDLPPVSEGGGTGGLASLCDQVSLVVEAERSRWEVVHRTQDQLDRVHARVLGVVLNKRQFHIPGWLYRSV
jgi:capsular exopolysaccharide synthesis family protein